MRANRIAISIAAVIALVAVVLTVGIATALAHRSTPSSAQGNKQDPLQAVHSATARYNSLTQATGSGYAILKDQAGIECIDNPGVGAMGVHYVNGDLVKSGSIDDPNQPQALVYEPGQDGQLHLVAIEYVVFQQQWDATHGTKPMLFGQTFMLTPDGNRFGLPAFYSLHVWLWKDNPTGMFSMWNPTVSCAAATPPAASNAPVSTPTIWGGEWDRRPAIVPAVPS